MFMDNKEIKRREFILNGPTYNVILAIALPIIIFNIITFCYSFVDAFMISTIDKTSVSAVFFFNQLSNVIRAIGLGLSTGGGVLVARCYGSGDFEKSKKISNAVFYLLEIITLFIVVLSIIGTPIILKLANTSESLTKVGYEYFIIQILTVFFTTTTSLYFAFERAKGKTINILIINIVSMVFKVALTALVVYVLKKGLTYVALATLTTNIIIFIIMMIDMYSKNNIFKLSLSGIKYIKDKEIIKSLLKISYPLVLSKLIFTIGKLSVSSLGIEYYNEDVVAALGLACTAAELATFITMALEDSIGSFVSQNVGAKNYARAKEMIKKTLHIVVASASISIIVLFIFSKEVVYLFVKGEDEVYQKLVRDVFKFELFSSLTSGIGGVLLGALSGYGYTKPSIYTSLARLFIFRIPVLIILAKVFNMPPYAIGLTMFISNFMYMVSSIILYLIYRKKINIKYPEISLE